MSFKAELVVSGCSRYKDWTRSIVGMNLALFGGFAVEGSWISRGKGSVRSNLIESRQNGLIMTCVELQGFEPSQRVCFVYDARVSANMSHAPHAPKDTTIFVGLPDKNGDKAKIILSTKCPTVGWATDQGILNYLDVDYNGVQQGKPSTHADTFKVWRDATFNAIRAYLLKNNIAPPSGEFITQADFEMRCRNAAYAGAAMATKRMIDDYGDVATALLNVHYSPAIDKNSVTSDESKFVKKDRKKRNGFITGSFSPMLNTGTELIKLPDGYLCLNNNSFGEMSVFVDGAGNILTAFELLNILADNWNGMSASKKRAWLAVFAQEIEQAQNMAYTGKLAHATLAGMLDEKSEKNQKTCSIDEIEHMYYDLVIQ